MPNSAVFTNDPRELKVQIFGSSESNAIQVDSNGKLQIKSIEDSVNISATDLDIRDLSSSNDSVAVYGSDDGGTTKRILKTSSTGALYITSDGTLTVQATDLDIRDLSNSQDSIAIYGNDGTNNKIIKTDSNGKIEISSIQNTVDTNITNENLDIRDLSNSQDSIAIYGNDGSTNRIIATDSEGIIKVANTKRIFTSTSNTELTTSDSYTYLSFVDVSMYSEYVFYVKNTGTNSADIVIEISPTDQSSDVIQHIEATIEGGDKTLYMPSKFLKYARLGYKSTTSSQSTTLDVYFQARY